MLEVNLKDSESFENMLRRFNKKVIQSGILSNARKNMYHEKPVSKTIARETAIRKRVRKEARAKAYR